MVSSVLRLIDDNAIYKDLYKFIIPHLFYATDKSDQTEALREILKKDYICPYCEEKFRLKKTFDDHIKLCGKYIGSKKLHILPKKYFI